jgi:hypothetical protein
MPKYILELTQTTVWEVEVEASSDAEALELTKDWGRDELDDNEITNNIWETIVWEKK